MCLSIILLACHVLVSIQEVRSQIGTHYNICFVLPPTLYVMYFARDEIFNRKHVLIALTNLCIAAMPLE